MKTCSIELQKTILNWAEKYLSDKNIDVKQFEDALQTEYKYNLSELYNSFSNENKEQLSDIVQFYLNEDVKPLILDKPIETITKNSIVSNFQSSEVTDLFHALPLIKNSFEQSSGKSIVDALLIGSKDSDRFVLNNEQLGSNINELKNNLFKTIQEFLIDKGIYKGKILELYDFNGKLTNYESYADIIKKSENYFFNGDNFNLMKSASEKKIPNIKANLLKPSDRAMVDAYNASVFLVNFDNVISNLYGHLINIDFTAFNNLDNKLSANNKYQSRIKGIETEYWLTDSQASESVETSESKLSKLLISTIPQLDKKGNFSGKYLEMKDFYLFASLLKDFELIHGNKLKNKENYEYQYFNENQKESFKWYLGEILNSVDNRSGDFVSEFSNTFKPVIEFVRSVNSYLYLKKDGKYSIEDKENNLNNTNSLINILTQVVNNSYGASYLKYNALTGEYENQELFKQNFNNTTLQNTVFTTLRNNYKKEEKYSKNAVNNFFNRISESLAIKDTDPLVKNNVVVASTKFKNKLGGFIWGSLGVRLKSDAIDSFLLNTGKDLTVGSLNSSLLNLFTSLESDFKSVFNYVSSKNKDKTFSKYIPDTIKNNVFKNIADAYLESYPLKPLMNVETNSGEKLPTFKTATLTYKDTELFEQQRSHERNNISSGKLFNSLLIKDDPIIIGTGVRLEVVNDDINKNASKWNVAENITAALMFDFIRAIQNPSGQYGGKSGFAVVLGNYSDKSTILSKLINLDAKYNGRRFIDMPSDEILTVLRSQSKNYYSDLFQSMFTKYKRVLDKNGIQNKIDISKFRNNIDLFNSNIKEINTFLKSHNILDFDGFTEELDYSTYDNKKTSALNQSLIDYYRVFNDDGEFNKFVAVQEKSLIDKYITSTGSNKIDYIFGEGKNITDVQKALKLDNKDFAHWDQISNQNGKLNPIAKKWMWLNNMFRTEYLYISAKGEYMHPHKDGELTYRGDNNKVDFDSFSKELSGRLSSMGKRNVLFTATIDSPVRKSRYGIPENVNLAVIEDFTASLHVPSGLIKKQEVHDGSSIIDAVYSRMIDASYPGKGYHDTKKQFATFITEHSAVVKKDAETVLTNSRIIDSQSAEISMLDKKEQMLSNPISVNKDIVINYKDKYYIENGMKYRLDRLTLSGNNFKINRTKINGENLEAVTPKTGTFENLFHIWKAIGGQYSIDADGNFSEGSNDVLYDVVTTPDLNGNYPLKDAMIHILSNKSAIKVGATNINKKEIWTRKGNMAGLPLLKYTTYENRFMGPQLDANHEANESQIREVSQVIAALAQNGNTAIMAQEAYENIAKVIQKSIQPYKKYLGISSDSNELYNYISRKFIDSVTNSNNVSLAKTLLQSFPSDIKIPFSNQNFFNLFVKDVISRMNNEFITRYYKGLGAVLNPSHGIIQLYEDANGNIYKQSDLIKEALLNNTESSLADAKIGKYTSNENIIGKYIANKLPDLPTTRDKIQIGDTVLIPTSVEDVDMSFDLTTKDFDQYAPGGANVEDSNIKRVIPRKVEPTYSIVNIPRRLNTLEEYYKFKKEGSLTDGVLKSLNTPRDLKPSEITFDVPQNEPIKEGIKTIFEQIPELLSIGNTQQYSEYINTIFPNSKLKNIVWHGTDADLSDGFNRTKRVPGTGSSSPRMEGDIYTSFQRYSTIPYIKDQGVKQPGHKFILQYFEVKELFKKLNKKDENDTSWKDKPIKDLIIDKRHEQEYKNDYHISEDADSNSFLRDVYDIDTNKTFNDWAKQNKEYFKNLEIKGKFPYPVLLNIENPYIESGKDTDYTEIIKNAKEKGNDGLIMYKNNDAFNSDVAVAFNDSQSYILGSKQDLNKFKEFVKNYKANTSTITKNIFDTESIKLRFALNNLKDASEQDVNTLTQLATYFHIGLHDFNGMSKILNGWTQRNLHLLDSHNVMKETSDNGFTKDGVIDFDAFFGSDGYHEGNRYKVGLLDNIFMDAKSHYVLNNSTPVYNYKFKPAELILPDLYESVFDKQTSSMSEIRDKGSNFFKDKLQSLYNVKNDKYDIKLELSNGNQPIYIKFVDNLSNSNVILKSDQTKDDEYNKMFKQYYKTDTNRNILYKISDNCRVISDEDRNEVIEILAYKKKTILDTDDRGKTTSKEVKIKTDTFEEDLQDLIKSFKGNIKGFIPLMNSKVLLYNEESGKFNNLHVNTLHQFLKFSGYALTTDDKLDETWFNKNKNNIVEQLGNKMYASWEKSHEFVAARIPSQSMQSFMEMKNVGYFNSKNNDAYVSIYQILLQGSDFDVDKAFILGSGFSKNGHFDVWSNISNYSNLEELNALEKLPLPNGKIVTLTGQGIDLTNEFKNYYDAIINKGDISKGLNSEAILALNDAIRKIGDNTADVTINDDYPIFKNMFIDTINGHNAYKGYLGRNDAINNSVISQIKQIISSPSNQLLANEPVDVQSLRNSVEKLPLEKTILSPWDMVSMYKQQSDAAVGKDDVGIAANGLKVLFALTNYYNSKYRNSQEFQTNALEALDLHKEAIRRSNASFVKNLNFVNNDGNIESFNIGSISDVQISNNQRTLLDLSFGKNVDILKENAAILASAFTSAATDNAKELLMAQLNASDKLASMHLYMISLGIKGDQIAEFMNSKVARIVSKELDTNIFINNKVVYVNKILSSLAKESNIQNYGLNENDLINLKTFKNIYDGAQEFKVLASLLKVNQRTSANVQEINNYLSKFEKALFAREHSIFGDSLMSLRYFGEDAESEQGKERDTKLLKMIFDNNSQLDPILDRQYVIDTLNRVKNIEIPDEKGTKKVSLLGGQFDFRPYIDENNDNYRKATVDYYNILKNTINIFDVVEKSPHFKAMIDGLVVSHNILLNSSAKYRFIFSESKDVIAERSPSLSFPDKDINPGINNYMGNPALPFIRKDRQISNTALYVDKIAVGEWLKSDKAGILSFNVGELLKKANIDKIDLYEENSQSNVDLVKTISANDNYILRLNSDSNISSFKKLMEQVLLPTLQDNINAEEFTESLKIENRNNMFNLPMDQITSTFPMGELSSPVNLEKFQTLLYEFNNLDISNKIDKISNSNGQSINWRDLFYTYNLIVNNESYGDKRLTPIFEDYVKEKDSLGYDYLLFSSKVDSGEIKLFDPKKALEGLEDLSDEDKINKVDQAKRHMQNDILFYMFNKNGSLTINPGDRMELSVKNPDFILNTTVSPIMEEKKQWKELNSLINLIKNNGYIIQFKC